MNTSLDHLTVSDRITVGLAGLMTTISAIAIVFGFVSAL